MLRRSATVGVGTCVVILGVAWGVGAPDKQSALPVQTVRGTLVAKATTALDVRAEDEQEVRLVAGGTTLKDFPTTPGAYQPTLAGKADAIIAKFSPAGKLVWSTLLGGSARSANNSAHAPKLAKTGHRRP